MLKVLLLQAAKGALPLRTKPPKTLLQQAYKASASVFTAHAWCHAWWMRFIPQQQLVYFCVRRAILGRRFCFYWRGGTFLWPRDDNSPQPCHTGLPWRKPFSATWLGCWGEEWRQAKTDQDAGNLLDGKTTAQKSLLSGPTMPIHKPRQESHRSQWLCARQTGNVERFYATSSSVCWRLSWILYPAAFESRSVSMVDHI